jgi:fused signal recognition particle receptor
MFEKLKKTFGSFFEKFSTQELSEGKIKDALEEFKLHLVENDVAYVVAEEIAEELKQAVLGLKVGRFEDKKKILVEALRNVLTKILSVGGDLNLLSMVEAKRRMGKPLTIVFVGINGTGKTTTIAKIAKFFLDRGYSVVLACSDTYRAGAIEQLEEHARRLGLRMIKHEYGSDPAAVAYDAVAHAESKGINVVLVDTAGRMETNRNLMEEMAKIVRVSNADLVFFVGDALTGNDAVFQAEEFAKHVRLDGSVLTKVDADAKGGAAISIAYITGKPIVFVGVGQQYEDLEPFIPERFVEKLVGGLAG